jgi:DNA polymerase/3'-5' exonuclease PolX
MKLDQATAIAQRVKAQLAPHCDRIEIAGSIRRKKPEVGDIEIVCIPKRISIIDLFGVLNEGVRSLSWSQTVSGFGTVVKGDPVAGKYVQVDLGEINLDIFTARPENWGLIYAIRTGSVYFARCVLGRAWVMAGYKSENGMLAPWRGGRSIPVREEEDLFRMLRVDWVEPEERT